MKTLTKTLAVFAFVIWANNAICQAEWRLGINLSEVYENRLRGISYFPEHLDPHFLNGVYVERQNERLIQRVSFRFLSFYKTRNIPFDRFDAFTGPWSYRGIDVGYDLVYQFQKWKRFRIGGGVYYAKANEHASVHSGWGGDVFYDYTSNAVCANVLAEANFDIGNNFYFRPSISSMFRFQKPIDTERTIIFSLNNTPLRFSIVRTFNAQTNEK